MAAIQVFMGTEAVTFLVVILAVLVCGLVVAFRTAQSHESSAIREGP